MHLIAPTFGKAAEVETIQTVAVLPGVTQQYSLLIDSQPAEITRAWVLFFGYDGHIEPGLIDGVPVFVGRGLLIDGRDLFLRDRSAVAVVDSPSNQHRMSAEYRTTDAYLNGTMKVIDDIHSRLPNAKIFLVGSSNGSISAVELAARMKARIAGVVVLSGVYQNDQDVDELRRLKLVQPLLFVHHQKDQCIPEAFTPAFIAEFHPVLVEDIGVHYASKRGPYSAHQFHGQEAAVIDLIYHWADGQPLPSQIR